MSRWNSILSSVLIVICGCVFIYFSTDGGRAWTTEAARKIDVLKQPRQVPSSQMIDANNIVTFLNLNKRIQLVDFIFTKCPTTCIGLGLEFRQLQNQILANHLDEEVQLISISFDLKNDEPEDMANYLQRFNARHDLWDGYIFKTEKDKKEMLDLLEVIVIPDEEVGFIHNTAIYMIEEGKVIEIFDFDSTEELLSRLMSRVTGNG